MMKRKKVNILLLFSCYKCCVFYECWMAANFMLLVFTLLLYFHLIVNFMIFSCFYCFGNIIIMVLCFNHLNNTTEDNEDYISDYDTEGML